MSYVTFEMESFLRELLTLGDDFLTCKRLGVDTLTLIEWESQPGFRSKKKSVEAAYLRKLEKEVARDSLKAIHNAIKFGEKTVTTANSTRQALDAEGDVVELTDSKLTTKISKYPSWAIREGIKLYMLQKIEDSIANQFRGLAENGMLPEDMRDHILMILESKDAEIQNIVQGNIKSAEITEELLAEVQAMVIGS